MYRGTSFIFPAHRVRPFTEQTASPRHCFIKTITPITPTANAIGTWTPFSSLAHVIILILLTVSTHPSDSVYTLQYQGGTFLVDRSQYQQLAIAKPHGSAIGSTRMSPTGLRPWIIRTTNRPVAQPRHANRLCIRRSRWDWAFYHGRYYRYRPACHAPALRAVQSTDEPICRPP